MPAKLLPLTVNSLLTGQMPKKLNTEREICEPRTALGVLKDFICYIEVRLKISMQI
jgi:hypothetical protein